MVLVTGEKSDTFGMEVSVKQGCAMAQVLFNICFAATNLLSNQRIREELFIHLTYRLDDNLFNLRRLKARTKVSHENLYELLYPTTALS